MRGIISICPELFEIDYIHSADRKLYFSSDLDRIFIDLTEFKLKENTYLENSYGVFLIEKELFPNNKESDTYQTDKNYNIYTLK